MSIEKKVAIVTGASSGIGAATAIAFAKKNYQLVITGRNQERLHQIAVDCQQKSPENLVPLEVIADFADSTQVDKVYKQTIEKFNRIDVLVNNAGFLGNRLDFNEDKWFDDYESIMQVNLHSPVRLCHLARKQLVDSKGSIVNISSIAARIPASRVSYNVSKAGLTLFSDSIANAFKDTGVRVNTVSPGPVETGIAPKGTLESYKSSTMVGRIGKSDEVAKLICFLADSSKSGFINAADYVIDGGLSKRCPFNHSAPSTPTQR